VYIGQRDGAKFTCKVHGCNVTDIAKYNLVQHLQMWHNVIMELGKLGHPSIWEDDLRHQDHLAMNAWVKTTLWLDCITMNISQLLGLGGTQTWSGIGSKLLCKTHLKFLSLHLFT
jgi:hypothetical protein